MINNKSKTALFAFVSLFTFSAVLFASCTEGDKTKFETKTEVAPQKTITVKDTIIKFKDSANTRPVQNPD